MATLTKNIFSKLSSYYRNINSSTLNGAIDIIVVQQEDGTLCCTPFHVRFGKLGVLQSQQTRVYIKINGVAFDDIYMQLGEAGEAAFVEENLNTPVLQPTHRLDPNDTNEFSDPENLVKLDSKSLNHISNGIDSTISLTNIQLDQKLSSTTITTIDESTPTVLTTTTMTTTVTTTNSTLTKLNETHLGINNSSIRRRFKRRAMNRFDKYDKALSDDDEQDLCQHYPSLKCRSRMRKRESAPHSCQSNRVSVSHLTTDEKIPRCVKLFRKRSASETEIPFSHVNLDSKPMSGSQTRFHSIESRPKTLNFNRENSNEQNEERIPTNAIGIEQNLNSSQTFEESDPLSTSALSKSLPINHPTTTNIRHSQSGDSTTDFFSNGDYSPNSSYESALSPRSSSPKSDTEYELEKASPQSNNSGWQWKWGKFPEQRGVFQYLWPSKKETPKDGIYLDEFTNSQQVDRSMYLPPTIGLPQTTNRMKNDDDQESGTGHSIPQSPSRETEQNQGWQDAQLSLCGWNPKNAPINDEQFNAHIITFESFLKNPLLMNDPNLVARIGGKFFTWNVACAMMVSNSFFQRTLPSETIERIQEKELSNMKPRQVASSGWWFFSGKKSETNKNETPVSDITIRPSNTVETPKMSTIPKFDQDSEQSDNEVKKLTARIEQEKEKQQMSTSQCQSNVFRKKMILSSDELKRLNLQFGKNKIEFSVTNAWQGTTTVESCIFFFDHNAKFVISDIDGTITRSDVLGHIIPLVGGDWSHDGIAEFYNAIQENGYQFIYLSARAIGQSQITRTLLSNVKQSDQILPSGPLLISPDNLLAALYREVIAKTPEQFKIECLKNISSLFPKKNPFYAGFGNRINDQWAYTAVGIPLTRIYTINPRGEVVRQELSQSLLSTYRNLHEMVDLLFPPMDSFSASETYSSYTYWREEPKCSIYDDEMRVDLEEISKRQKPNKSSTKTKKSNSTTISEAKNVKTNNDKLPISTPTIDSKTKRT